VQHKSTKNTGAAQALEAMTQQKANIKKMCKVVSNTLSVRLNL
jgi:hypothetical protein